jgi:hypothetical protein
MRENGIPEPAISAADAVARFTRPILESVVISINALAVMRICLVLR